MVDTSVPFNDNVFVSIKEAQPLHIEIDIDALTVNDIEFIEKLSRDQTSTSDLIDFLARVMPNADIRSVPLRALPRITNAVLNAIGGASDPNG